MPIMFILRGPSGSGKSTEAEKLLEKYPQAVICSTDNYFVKDGKYFFDGAKIKQYHQINKNQVEHLCTLNTDYIIVDNTNTQMWEYQPYLNLANKYNYQVIVVEPTNDLWNTHKMDMTNEELEHLAQKLFERNVHGVSKDVILKQLKRWEF
jgi:NEDD4-binding protein 2